MVPQHHIYLYSLNYWSLSIRLIENLIRNPWILYSSHRVKIIALFFIFLFNSCLHLSNLLLQILIPELWCCVVVDNCVSLCRRKPTKPFPWMIQRWMFYEEVEMERGNGKVAVVKYRQMVDRHGTTYKYEALRGARGQLALMTFSFFILFPRNFFFSFSISSVGEENLCSRRSG